jgi:17beta-estradiol 17-dehydrogenase / very-long-chain 3-oxoacyl-CoA reductase
VSLVCIFLLFPHHNTFISKTESKYGVQAKYFNIDFSAGKEIYDELRKHLSSLDIGILVNNVGIFHGFPNDFDLIPENLIWKLLAINVGAATMMSRMIIPQMKKNKRGLIANVSSATENQPIPLEAIYAASKVYVKHFTLGNQHALLMIILCKLLN